MPVAAGIVLSAAFAGFSAAAFAGFSLAAFAGSLVLGGISYALTPKPKKPNFGIDDKGQTIAVRQSDLTRQYVYGHIRITRGYAHMESTGLNGTLHNIIMLCEGPIRAINEIWVNDYVIPNDWIDADGNVIEGRYKDKMIIRKHLGTEDQLADSLAVNNMQEWTTAHRLQGIAYLYVVMTKDQDVYPTGVPNISAVVEGMSVYDPREEENLWTTNIALFAHDFISNQRYGFGAFEDDIDELNTAAQANICDEIVDTTPVNMSVDSVDVTNNRLTLKDPNGSELLLYQFGDRVRISSTGTVPSGLSAGVDYYVIPYQVRGTPRILLAESLDNSLRKIPIDITSAGSGTITISKTGEPRYHGGGVIDTETELNDTLSALCSSMAGRAVNVAGYWTLLAGAWRAPAITFGISDIRGNGYGIRNCNSMSDNFNVVNGVFTSSLNHYQTSNYPSARYQQFIDDDNGIESPTELNLIYTNRPTTAQRIAKIELFKARQDIIYTSDFSMKGIQVIPGDNVYLDIDRLGWEQKPFEITEFSFSEASDSSLVTKLTLRETAQAIYDWTSGEAIDYDPAPNTNLTDPFTVQVVSGVSYNSRFIETREGDAVYSLVLQWNLHSDAFVREFGDYEVQYKLSSEADWRPSFFVDGHLTETDVVSATVNVYYDLRIRARNNLGVRSQWVTLYNAMAGTSGGVGDTRDYEHVNDPVVHEFDYGSVADAHTSEEDWGYVQ